MADRHLNIVIAARSMVSQAFQTALAQTRSFSDQVTKSTGGRIEATMKFLGAMSKVRIGIDAARIGMDLFRGDTEAAAETVKKLPFGLGPLAQGIEDILMDLTGIRTELDRIKATEEAWKAQDKRLDEINAALARMREIQAANTIEALDGIARVEAELARARDKRLADLHAMGQLTPFLERMAAAEAAKVWARYYKDLDALRAEHRAKREEEARQQAETLRELDSEIRQKTLAAQGRELEAELERIREHYRRRLDLAKDAAERERLLRLRQLDEDEARRRQMERDASAAQSGVGEASSIPASRGGIAAVQVGEGFLGLAAQFAAGREPMVRLNRTADRIADLIQQTLRAIREQQVDRVIAGTVVRP